MLCSLVSATPSQHSHVDLEVLVLLASIHELQKESYQLFVCMSYPSSLPPLLLSQGVGTLLVQWIDLLVKVLFASRCRCKCYAFLETAFHS